MTSLRYRPDIDGLRAVAVLGVIVYHAFPKALPGGFTGVDIFFVISGYLISGILYKGVKAGDFSFSEFYARRVRRLFPSLVAVLGLCLAYGFFVLLRGEYEQLGKHVAAGAVFIQNIVFWQECGYFDTAADTKPLLHLWSLAVEEQFYIFFPPLLLLVARKRWPMARVLGGLFLASLIGNLLISRISGSAAFFLTPWRSWEFLGGSLLAWWHFERGHEEDVPVHRHLLSFVGVLLLAAGFAFIHEDAFYPGWRALLPVCGTVLVMEGGKGAWFNRFFLSYPAIVWIGLISYPLYLFHWPALSFLHIVKGTNPPPGVIWMALGVALVLTIFTYYLIEKPLRHTRSRAVFWLLVASFLIAGIFGWIIWRKGIYPTTTARIEQVAFATKNQGFFDGWETDTQGNVYLCRVGGKEIRTLYLGDSNMWHYAPRIRIVVNGLKDKNTGVLMLGSGGRPPIPGVIDPIKTTAIAMGRLMGVLQENPLIRRVVIAANWDPYFKKGSKFEINGHSLATPIGENEAIAALGALIRSLHEQGKEVVLVLSVPNGDVFDPRHFITRTFTGISISRPVPVSREEFLNGIGDFISRKDMKRVALANGAEVIDPLDFLCIDGWCIQENEQGPIRFDKAHLRKGYVKDHVTYLDRTVMP